MRPYILFLTLCLAQVLSGCGSRSPIVGSWRLEGFSTTQQMPPEAMAQIERHKSEMTIEFSGNGELLYNMDRPLEKGPDAEPVPGTWEITPDNKTIRIQLEGEARASAFEVDYLSENQLVLVRRSGDAFTKMTFVPL